MIINLLSLFNCLFCIILNILCVFSVMFGCYEMYLNRYNLLCIFNYSSICYCFSLFVIAFFHLLKLNNFLFNSNSHSSTSKSQGSRCSGDRPLPRIKTLNLFYGTNNRSKTIIIAKVKDFVLFCR
jgi:hypothetical protein